MARVNGFLVTAKIFIPYDPSKLDGAAETIAALKQSDKNDIAGLKDVGGIVMETSRKFTSKDIGDLGGAEDATGTAAAEDGENNEGDNTDNSGEDAGDALAAVVEEPANDPAPKERAPTVARRGRKAA